MRITGMKTGQKPDRQIARPGMAGPAAVTHLFHSAVSSIFGRLQAVGRYVRHPHWTPRFAPATLCLALAFVFFNAAGAMAQETPDGSFDANWPRMHDGKTPFAMKIIFNGQVDPTSFTMSDITFAVPNPCDVCVPSGKNFATDYAPTVSALMQDLANDQIWTFMVTPRADADGISPDFSVSIPAGAVTGLLPGLVNSTQINSDNAPMPRKVIIRGISLVAEAGDPRSVPSGTQGVQLDGTGSTATSSGRTVTYAWTWTQTGGDAATVTLSDENILRPTFDAPTLTVGATAATYVFTLTVTDSLGSTDATDTVTITVLAPLAPLVAEAGPNQPAVPSGMQDVQLEGSGTATDSRRTVTYAWTWTQTGGDAATVTLSDENILRPTFDAPTLTVGATAATYVFTLTVTDDQGSTDATDTVTITVLAPLAPLVAEAGPNQPAVPSGMQDVQLEGSGTATDSRRTVTYAWTWTQTGGDAATVTLSDMTMLRPTFDAPTLTVGATAATYVFTLTVTDDQGSTDATDTVTITVLAPLAPLVAEAGPNQPAVPSGMQDVQLEGSGTATDSRRTVTYAWTWTQTGGDAATVTLSDMTMLRPTFDAPTLTVGATAATYVFTLTVTDDQGSTDATDTVTITVLAPLAPLVAEAGPNQPAVPSGMQDVQLEGSGTATDSRRTVTYAWTWTQTGGDAATVTLSDMTMLRPTFDAPTLTVGATAATYVFTLTVTDDQGSTDATDTVTITVLAPLAPLVAEAGPNQPAVPSGMQDVQLEGSGTATDSRRTVTYAWTWTQTGGDAATVTLSDMTMLRPTFDAPTLTVGATAATYVFTLTVTDDQGSTDATDTVTITVLAPLAPLVAEAGPNQPAVPSGMQGVQLEGSGTATDSRRTVTYAWTWTQTGGDAATVTLSDENILRPTFDAPTLTVGATAATYVFTLTVTDDQGSTDATDTVTITVLAPLAPLVAEAGPNQPAVPSGMQDVQLEGSGTATDSRRTVTYAWTWTQTGGDAATVTLSDMTMLRPTFDAPTLTVGATAATYVFTLTVTDDQGSTDATDTVTITVLAPLAPLVAEAGPNQPAVPSGMQDVQLEGSGTATDSRRTVTYAWTWTQTGGDAATVTLSDMTMLRPTFDAPTLTVGATAATYVFTLTVTDDQGSTDATDTVTITVLAPLAPLVAEAGPNQPAVPSGMQGVQLEGSGTATDSRRTVTYAWTWTQTGGDAATVTLSDMTMLRPTFDAPPLTVGATAATYVFTLTVTDDQGSTAATDTVTITVTAATVDIVLEPSEVSVQEGGSGTYRVKLSEAPRREVVITATSGNEGVVRLKNTRLVFNTNNWNDWQEVEINAVADSVKKDDRIEVPITHSIDGVASNRLAAVAVTVRAQEDDPIMAPVGQFIATRATALLGQQPDLTRFLKQDGPTAGDGGAFNFQATDGRLSLDGGFIHNGTWGEVTGARTDSESSDTESALASFGIHRKYSETFLAGAMLQFDLADRDLSQQAGTIDGTGWLVGPYFVARHGSQPLYFEGRLLYGQSDNDIRFIDPYLGVRTGSFDSARLLAQIRVEGEIAVPGHGDGDGDDGGADGGPRLIPYADIRWVEDRAAAFTTVSATTGVRTPVPGQTVNISQLELGSNMVIPVAVRTGSMILTGGLGVIWSNTEGDHIRSDARGRGRGELGFSYGLDNNLRIGFDSFYDGIGASRYESYGLSLTAEMKF